MHLRVRYSFGIGSECVAIYLAILVFSAQRIFICYATLGVCSSKKQLLESRHAFLEISNLLPANSQVRIRH